MTLRIKFSTLLTPAGAARATFANTNGAPTTINIAAKQYVFLDTINSLSPERELCVYLCYFYVSRHHFTWQDGT